MNAGETVQKSPEEVRLARFAALLPKYEAGERLPKGDQQLVEAELARRAGPAAPAPGAAAAPAFELRADLPGPSSYRAYKEYLPVYLVSERSIKAWVARGRDAKDWPPLNEPERMADWYSRVLNPKIPARLAALAEKGSASAAAEGPSAPPEPSAGIDISQLAASSIETQIKGLAQTVSACHIALQKAYLEGRPESINSRQAAYRSAIETLQRLETAQEAAKMKRGDYLPKADVEADAAALASSLKAMRRGMVARVLEMLSDVPEEIRGRVAAAIETVRAAEDALFRAASVAHFPQLPHVENARAA